MHSMEELINTERLLKKNWLFKFVNYIMNSEFITFIFFSHQMHIIVDQRVLFRWEQTIGGGIMGCYLYVPILI